MSLKYIPSTLVSLILGISSFSPLVGATTFSSDFSDGFGPWQKSPTGIWSTETADGKNYIVLNEAGTQPGGVRRPTGYLLLPQFSWTDYTVNLRAQTLEPATVTRRDIVIIFGYVDPTHFYYTHVSSSSDDTFHNIIMKVDGETRTNIDLETMPEAKLTGEWHNLRVEHDRTGAIRVFVDDMNHPNMTAFDQSYPQGAVGFGSFDDRARYDHIEITGNAAPTAAAEVDD